MAGRSDQAPDIGVLRRLNRLKPGGVIRALDAGENLLSALRLDLRIGKVHRRASARGRVGIEARHQLLQAADMLLRLVEIGLGPDHRRRILKRILDNGDQPVFTDAVADMQRLVAEKAIDRRCRGIDPGGHRRVADDHRAKIGGADPGDVA